MIIYFVEVSDSSYPSLDLTFVLANDASTVSITVDMILAALMILAKVDMTATVDMTAIVDMIMVIVRRMLFIMVVGTFNLSSPLCMLHDY